MTVSDEPLFREEVLRHRVPRLQGDVNIAVPVSWQLISYFLGAAVVAAVGFLVVGSYSRVETVPGVIVLDKGVASVVPSRRGVVSSIFVREGELVGAGQPLVEIRSEEDTRTGATAPERLLEALSEQEQRLERQTAHTMTAAAAQRARLSAGITGLQRELQSLENRIAAQRRLIEVARNEYRQVQSVSAKGFISRREVEARESALLARQQELDELEQERSSKAADIAETRRSVEEALASAEARAAGLHSDQAALRRQRVEAEVAQGYTLAAPVAGRVAALVARNGQPAEEAKPLMVVVPLDAKPGVELYVPTRAVGFLSPGQEVRVAVDAYPYQRFGTFTAHITDIASAATPRQTSSEGIVAIYLVQARLPQGSVMAFERNQGLLPGMTLSGRIVTRKQSLFEWLFEPLFAIGRR